ncbi:nuclear transport factor 2 family protein [Streptomyces marincola]|uniref:nuclear transport factor 2 family protein n=1 Tax=Streptomyces marincola TaxID=2878388 RepID=UPI001CF454E0|nr:nuclear transport factor 2 family protein [Streptomyces marincola]UCM87414.1 nuclear transport factor 2 family protein [Streptomyces marincola]
MDDADRHQLTDLVSRLGRCLDQKRFGDLRAVFVEDASVATAGGTVLGIDAIVEKARAARPADVMTQSFATNPLIEVDGGTATITANLLVAFVGRPEGRGRLFAERYHLAAARTPRGWRVSRVDGVPLWEAALPEVTRFDADASRTGAQAAAVPGT